MRRGIAIGTWLAVFAGTFLVQGLLLATRLQEPAAVLAAKDYTGEIIGVVTSLLGFGYVVYRENRARRWEQEREDRARTYDLEDRRLARVEAKEDAEARHRVTLGRIHENTELTVTAIGEASKAYSEANDVNQKIAQLTKLFNQVEIASAKATSDVARNQHVLTDSTAAVLNRVDATTQETLTATQETLSEVKKQAEP